MLKNVAIILLCCFGTLIQAQNLSNYVSKSIVLDKDTMVLDSLSISPSTFNMQVDGKNIENYTLDAGNSMLIVPEELKNKTVNISYRTFPVLFGKKYFNRDYSAYKKETESTGFLISNSTPSSGSYNQSLIDFGNLEYNGNISRGVGFGNAQSLNVNSSFNFQLLGMITKDIEVKAVISDNNIPIQPEGNTATLQEFDKVYIQLRKDEHYLRVGDFDLKSPGSYFMKFQRNLQGASYHGKQKVKELGTASGMASFAVARGNFCINNITAIEGNQGPYRLQGNNGEAYIIVMSGSERVFINGVQLQRGDNNDYVIDYNLGELRFTPNKMITQDMRIRVEFEYAERNYLRTLYHLNGGFEHEKIDVSVNFFSQQDAKRQTINQDLDDDKIAVLENAGDNVESAFASGIKQTDFDASRVLYEQKDTVINGIIDTFYTYSTNKNATLYSLNFSNVGQNNGSYELTSSVANGRVFKYVGPNLGSYQPIIKVIAPEMQQLFTSRVAYKPIKNMKAGAEFALSNRDLNTFSKIDRSDNIGYGLNLFFNQTINLKKDSTKAIIIDGNYEFKQQDFKPLERYRAVEFNRNWSINNDTISQDHLANFSISYIKQNKGNISYNFSMLKQGNIYTGYENSLLVNYNTKGFETENNIQYLYANTGNKNIHFFRPKLNIAQNFAKNKTYKIGATLNNEINQQRNTLTDSLYNESFLWQEYGFYIQNQDSLRQHFKLNYKLRFQHIAKGESFDKPYLKAHQIELTGRILAKKNHTLNYNLTYRNLQQDTLFSAAKDLNHFYLGRIDYGLVLWKGAVRANTMYEIGAGREQKIQYTYVESPDGVGSFAWNDINENGVQELNEFYVSAFANENRFIKFFQNSLEFQPVNSTQFNQSIQLNPKAVWFKQKGFQSFIARFSTNTAFQFSKKVFATGDIKAINVLSPFVHNLNDSLLVSNNTNIRNVIFFNRSDTKYGFEYTYQFSNSKTLLTSGFERRKFILNEFKARWNFIKDFTLNGSYRTGFKQNDSDFYFDRKYEYILNEAGSSLSWLFKKMLRIEVEYEYSFKSNPLPQIGGQFAVSNEISTNLRFSKANNYNITSTFSFVSVGYNDDSYTNEQLQFDMLQGLQEGNNFVWNVGIDKTFAKLLQVSVQYDGRKTGITKPVHGGRVQVRAVF